MKSVSDRNRNSDDSGIEKSADDSGIGKSAGRGLLKRKPRKVGGASRQFGGKGGKKDEKKNKKMATLVSGTLQKLLQNSRRNPKKQGTGTGTGTAEENQQQHCTLLQVMEIAPVRLDEKTLWPSAGFYIKVSDSRYAAYTALAEQDMELVLSNKLQLGQFVYVERLQLQLPQPQPQVGSSSSSVPILCGLHPLPGRRAIVASPNNLALLDNVGRPVTCAPGFHGELTLHGCSKVAARKMYASSNSNSSISCFDVSTDVPPPLRPPASVNSQRNTDSKELLGGKDRPERAKNKNRVPFTNVLNTIVQEAMQKQNIACKVALESMNIAALMDRLANLVRNIEQLSCTAKLEDPDVAIESFMKWHKQISVVTSELRSGVPNIPADGTGTLLLKEKINTLADKGDLAVGDLESEVKDLRKSFCLQQKLDVKDDEAAADFNKSVWKEGICRSTSAEASISDHGSLARKTWQKPVNPLISYVKTTLPSKMTHGKRPPLLPRSILSSFETSNLDAVNGDETISSDTKQNNCLQRSQTVKLAEHAKFEAERWFADFLQESFDSNLKLLKAGDCREFHKWLVGSRVLLSKVLAWMQNSERHCAWLNFGAAETVKALKQKLR